MNGKFPDQEEVIEILSSSDEASPEDDPWGRSYKSYLKNMKKENLIKEESDDDVIFQSESKKEEPAKDVVLKTQSKKEEPVQKVILKTQRKMQEPDQDVIFQSECKIMKYDTEFKTIANISFAHLKTYTIYKCLICREEMDSELDFQDHLNFHLNDGSIRSETSFCTTCNLQFNGENLIGEFYHMIKYHYRLQNLDNRIVFEEECHKTCNKVGYEVASKKVVERVDKLPCVQIPTELCKSYLSNTTEKEQSKNLNEEEVEFDEPLFSIISGESFESTPVPNEYLPKNISTTISEVDSDEISKSSEKEADQPQKNYDYDLSAMFTPIVAEKVTIISNEIISTESEESNENSANFLNMPLLDSEISNKQHSPSSTSDGESLKMVLTSRNGFKTASVKSLTGLGDSVSPKPRPEKKKKKSKTSSKDQQEKSNEDLVQQKESDNDSTDSYENLSLKSRQKSKSKKMEFPARENIPRRCGTSKKRKLPSTPEAPPPTKKILLEKSQTAEPLSTPKLPMSTQKAIPETSPATKKNSIEKSQTAEPQKATPEASRATKKNLIEKSQSSEPTSIPKLPMSTQKAWQSWEEGQMQPLKPPPNKTSKDFSKIQDLISAEKSCLVNESASTSKASVKSPEPATHSPKSKNVVSTKELMSWMSTKATQLRHNTKLADMYANMLSKKCLLDFYKCMDRDCCYTTSDVRLFVFHMRQHLKNSEGQKNGLDHCPYCELVIKSDIDLEKKIAHHIHDAHQNEIYQCSKCFYRSREPETCYEHLNLKHPKDKKIMHKCPAIPKTAEKERLFIEQSFQRIKKKKLTIAPITCPICPVKIYLVDDFFCHLDEHSEVAKAVPDKEKIVEEAIQHVREKFANEYYGVFQCLFCQQASTGEDEISKHMTKHSSELRYCCIRKRAPFRESYRNPYIEDEMISNNNPVTSVKSMLIHKIELQTDIDINLAIEDCSHI